MGKKCKKVIDFDVSVGNHPYKLRKRKPIHYYLGVKNKQICNIKEEMLDNYQSDTVLTSVNQYHVLNHLKPVNEKQELNEPSQRMITSKNSDPNFTNEIKIKKELIENSDISSALCDKLANYVTKVKDEPLSQASEDYSQVFNNEETSSEDLIIGSSVVNKDCALGGSVKGFPHDQYNNTCESKTSYSNNTICRPDEEEKHNKKIVKKLISCTEKIKGNLPLFVGVPSISSNEFQSLLPGDLDTSEGFKPFQRIKKKVVFVKQEQISKSEKEQIEEEKDEACRRIAARTGGIWRRLPPVQRVCGYIPDMPDVVPIYTPSGQRFDLYPNEDRPVKFPTREDKENWDHATRINVLRTISDIEDGSYIPPGVNIEREKEFKELRMTWDRDFEILADVYISTGGDFTAELRFFELEEKLLDWNLHVHLHLPALEYETNQLTNALILSDLHEFLFVKNYYAFDTLKEVTKQNKYPDLQYKTILLLEKLKNICRKTSIEELEEHIHSKAMKLLNNCKDYPIPVFNLLTPTCKEAIELDESSNLLVQFDAVSEQGNHEESLTNISSEVVTNPVEPTEEAVITLNRALVSEE